MKTIKFDYVFSFSSIQNQYTQAQVYDCSADEYRIFKLLVNDKTLSINGLSTVPSIAADLIDLAIAIHAVDRLVKRRIDHPYSFRIELPIRNFDVFHNEAICDTLFKILDWYTNDFWHFNFLKRDEMGRAVEAQPQLPLRKFPENKEIALWSGGLDSLSGLYTRLLDNSETHFVLVGTGSNPQVIKQQEKIALKIKEAFPNRISLIQIPYRWSETSLPDKNFAQRARGLVFMLIGAACAYHVGCNTLNIYENGVGAINLPYSRTELGLDHAKSVHPLSLLYVGRFVSSVFDSDFRFNNPFWLWTKAQMVKSLANTEDVEIIKLTSSCDRSHRLSGGVVQCGMCTSCLLRRQSLIALNVCDPTGYADKKQDNLIDPLQYMQFQVKRIRTLLEQHDPWVSLSKEYHELNDIVDHVSQHTGVGVDYLRSKIIQLYSRYVDEWVPFEEFIEKILQTVQMPTQDQNEPV